MTETQRRFDGRVALVTGGANGMGRACALRFAAEGAKVVVADVLTERADEVAEEISTAGGEAFAVAADMLDADAARGCVAATVERYGAPDAVVLAAGIPTARYRSGGPDPRVPGADPLQTYLDTPIEDWDEVVGVNLRGTSVVLQAALGEMVPRGSGSVVVITSTAAANQTFSSAASYSASKAGAWALVKHVARLAAPAGVRVNAVGPGLIETKMSEGYLRDERNRDAVLAAIPLGRAGTVDDIAASVLFLCSDEANFITGEALYVDGGQFTG